MTNELTIGELTELSEGGIEKRADYIIGWSSFIIDCEDGVCEN
ncbi:hypothetical protein OB920_19455 [Halobacteria archaeon HArc-gm2]|nr:hypothetical protein [Halobacteria archaeon HArc-gm2]